MPGSFASAYGLTSSCVLGWGFVRAYGLTSSCVRAGFWRLLDQGFWRILFSGYCESCRIVVRVRTYRRVRAYVWGLCALVRLGGWIRVRWCGFLYVLVFWGGWIRFRKCGCVVAC